MASRIEWSSDGWDTEESRSRGKINRMWELLMPYSFISPRDISIEVPIAIPREYAWAGGRAPFALR